MFGNPEMMRMAQDMMSKMTPDQASGGADDGSGRRARDTMWAM